MALPEDDRRALLARLAPAGASAVDVVASAVDEGEELREIVVDAQGDVVAFTDRRALFVADGAADVVAVTYDEVELRRRDAGLAIDALIEGGRLVLDVARGTFARLAVVGTGAPPGRATWLPVRAPAPRPVADVTSPPLPPTTIPPAPPAPPAPVAPIPPATPTAPGPPRPPRPALSARPAPAPTAPVPVPVPATAPPDLPPPGWHPDPAGRHWWRWWDGFDWTGHVADGGAPFVDPLPPKPT